MELSSSEEPTPRQVLGRINAVLLTAGLNDNIFSIRDCNSSLFLLLFKKARKAAHGERNGGEEGGGWVGWGGGVGWGGRRDGAGDRD